KGYWKARGYTDEFAELWDGNALLYAKTIVNQGDCTLAFSNPRVWGSQPRQAYETIAIIRALLALAGAIVCFSWWKQQPSAAALVAGTLAMIAGLYCVLSVYNWQEERYFLRF